jgi:hypothetical protein
MTQKVEIMYIATLIEQDSKYHSEATRPNSTSIHHGEANITSEYRHKRPRT